MAGNSINPAQINQMVASDANQIGNFLAWLERRIYQWQSNCGTAADMAALGYSATTDQAEIIQHIANLNAMNACITGAQTAANTHDMRPDLAALQGIS